jgi:hypothetical protein
MILHPPGGLAPISAATDELLLLLFVLLFRLDKNWPIPPEYSDETMRFDSPLKEPDKALIGVNTLVGDW